MNHSGLVCCLLYFSIMSYWFKLLAWNIYLKSAPKSSEWATSRRALASIVAPLYTDNLQCWADNCIHVYLDSRVPGHSGLGAPVGGWAYANLTHQSYTRELRQHPLPVASTLRHVLHVLFHSHTSGRTYQSRNFKTFCWNTQYIVYIILHIFIWILLCSVRAWKIACNV